MFIIKLIVPYTANSIHKLPKLDKYFLCGCLIAIFTAVLYLSWQYAQIPVNQLGATTSSNQIVKSWNFNENSEGWINYFTGDVQIQNGYFNIAVRQAPPLGYIQNGQVQASLRYPLNYLAVRMAIQKNPKLTLTNTNFAFNVYYKKPGSDSWFGPRTLSGIISPFLKEYYVRIPVLTPPVISELKIEFSSGVVTGDIIKIDSIRLLNMPQVTPTPASTLSPKPIPTCTQRPACLDLPTPCQLVIPPGGFNWCPRPTYTWISPTPIRIITTPKPVYPSCYPPPPCYYGVKDQAGNISYCLPSYPNQWCPLYR